MSACEARGIVEQPDHSRVLGRERELAEIDRFVAATPGGPRTLVLEGSAGIGKTTLWEAGIGAAHAAGIRVLDSRAAESEATLSYSGLGDLFDPALDEAATDLPEPQRQALDAALLRADDAVSVPDRRAISLGALGVVRALAAQSPVVIALDDVQWLDTSTAHVVAFVLRRLANEPVRMIVSLRHGAGSSPERLELAEAIGRDRVERVLVGPLDEEATGRLLRSRLGVDLSRSVILRIHEVAQGNPLFALEIGRAIVGQDMPQLSGEQFPVPEDLRRLLAARVGALPATADAPLLAIACLTHPSVDTVLGVADRPDDAREGLAAAEAAGVVERVGDRIRFSHPLLGSTVYAAAAPGDLRALHHRLAEHVVDAEERARHLALASAGPDGAIAAELDAAARHARSRGAPDAAAELAELALQRTPAEDANRLRLRRLDAAGYHFDAGDAPQAIELLRLAGKETAPGPARAEILYRMSSMSWMNLEHGVRAPLMEALPEAGEDPALVAGIELDLAWVDIYQGDLDAALTHGRASVGHAERSGDPAINADAVASYAMVRFLRGEQVDQAMTDAIASQDEAMEASSWTDVSVYTTPRSILGLQQMWAGDLEAARSTLEHELAEYERLGMYTLRQEVLCYLAELGCRAGRWVEAAAYAADAAETVAGSGMAASQTHVVRFNQALAAAYLGQAEESRRLATEGLELARANDDAFNGSWNGAVLGFLDLSLGEFDAAHDHLAPVVAYLDRAGAAEPGVIPCVPDDVEALIALGRTEEARAALEPFEAKARAKDRPWARAAALRCGGALAAADGAWDAARVALDAAAEQHARTSQPFETARTAMVRGIVERRAKQKRAARANLEEAVRVFDELGAPLWSERARAELVRVVGEHDTATELTPTEVRVAHLVAEGKTNREVADALFVSAKTVEANLTRIFHKLGMRSRADLIRRRAEIAEEGASGPGA
jgi:DNA-binding CsgD family transcriptional regulator